MIIRVLILELMDNHKGKLLQFVFISSFCPMAMLSWEGFNVERRQCLCRWNAGISIMES